MLLTATTIIATLAGLASAAVFPRDQGSGSGFKILSQSKIDKYSPFSYYAAAATCSAGNIASWQCGTNCQANSGFQVAASGGGSQGVPNWYVGFDSYLQTIVVGHQGTNNADFFSNLANSNSHLTSLDGTYFPNISSSVQVNQKFAKAHSQTAVDVIQAVESLLNEYPTADVTVVGYSLGAAIALLDGVFLSLQLGPQINIKVIGYGMPRVGNQYFAGFVDAILPNGVVHINNMMDPVPVVPSIQSGYVHCAGEIHIQEVSGEWIACPGDDNPDPHCIAGSVTSLSNATLTDHIGPYNNIMMRC